MQRCYGETSQTLQLQVSRHVLARIGSILQLEHASHKTTVRVTKYAIQLQVASQNARSVSIWTYNQMLGLAKSVAKERFALTE